MPTKFSELEIKPKAKGLLGDKIKIERIFNREIMVEAFLVKPSNYKNERGEFGECLHMQFAMNGNKHVVFTGSEKLIEMIREVPSAKFPFITTIIKAEDDSFQFT